MKTTLSIRRKRPGWLLALALSLPAGAPAFAAALNAPQLNAPQDATIDGGDAAQPLNQGWRIGNDATVEIHNVRGSVSVSAGEPERALLTGDLGAGSRLLVSGNAQHLQLRVDAQKDHGWFGNTGPQSDSNLILKLPAGVSLRLELVSADAKVSGIGGKSLNVDGVSGKLTLDSAAEQIDVESVSGDVSLAATRAGADHRTHVQTVSGDIEVTGANGRMKLETVSGRARATGNEVQEFEAGTVSGDVELDAAAIGKHGRIQVGTMSGEVRTRLPPAVSAHIEAESFSGHIRSDFGTVKKPQYGPGSSLDATSGDGDAQISAKSFSGSVEILKRS